MKKGKWKLSDEVGYRGIITIERKLFPETLPEFTEKKLIHVTELNFYIHK